MTKKLGKDFPKIAENEVVRVMKWKNSITGLGITLMLILVLTQFNREVYAAVSPTVLILGGETKQKMNSSLPKVLHEIAGKPLLFHLLSQIREALPESSIGLVVESEREKIESYIQSEPQFLEMQIQLIPQEAPGCSEPAIQREIESFWVREKSRQPESGVLVVPGNCPLISSELIKVVTQPLEIDSSARLVAFTVPNATDVSISSMVFVKAEYLMESYSERQNNRDRNDQERFPDWFEMADEKVSVLHWPRGEDLQEINDFWDLSVAHRIMNLRGIKKWAKCGVNFLDPDSTQVHVSVVLEEGVCIHRGVILNGNTCVGRGTVVESGAVLTDVKVGENVHIKTGSVIEKSRIGNGSQIGPYAHFRPESEVGENVKIGNFVELKKTRISDRSAVAHLSYLGDAEVGHNVNVGCGFITCNFDGRIKDGSRKHRTIIEDDVFLGSDCQAIAPVRIGARAIIAAGSTITEDVEPDALAIARTRQVTKPGYAKRFRGQG